MVKKTETKTEKLEREYVIPLRRQVKKAVRYKKTPKAIKTIKEFLVKHMKIYDRDLSKIKIDKYLNEFVWFRGIKRPPAKIKVKAIKEGDVVRVTLAEFPDKLKFKKLREERKEKAGEEAVKKKKTLIEKAKEGVTEKPAESDEKTEETKEKQASVVEAGRQMEKAQAKQLKHQSGGKMKAKTQPQRKSLEK